MTTTNAQSRTAQSGSFAPASVPMARIQIVSASKRVDLQALAEPTLAAIDLMLLGLREQENGFASRNTDRLDAYRHAIEVLIATRLEKTLREHLARFEDEFSGLGSSCCWSAVERLWKQAHEHFETSKALAFVSLADVRSARSAADRLERPIATCLWQMLAPRAAALHAITIQLRELVEEAHRIGGLPGFVVSRQQLHYFGEILKFAESRRKSVEHGLMVLRLVADSQVDSVEDSALAVLSDGDVSIECASWLQTLGCPLAIEDLARMLRLALAIGNDGPALLKRHIRNDERNRDLMHCLTLLLAV